MAPKLRRSSLVLGVALLALAPATAAATDVRKIADVPVAGDTDQGVQVLNVAAGGQRVVASAEGTLVAADAATGISTPLPDSSFAQASQSPSGDYVAWSTRRSVRSCRPEVRVARSDALAAARVLTLPTRYRRSAVDGIAVADDGRVTLRVGRCRGGYPDGFRAILSATPGASTLGVVTQSRSGYAEWPVSQNGRVFAVCTPVRRTKSSWTSEVTVVGSDAGLTVRRARLSTNSVGIGPACVASDAGTATMMVIRARKAPHKFTNVGITVGGRGTPRFSLPGGTRDHGIGLLSVRPDGTQVVTRFDVPEASVIHTRTGRYSRAFRPPPHGGTWTRVGVDGMPLPWSPYAPAVVTANSGSIGIFNPSTLKTRRLGRVVPRRGGGLATTCFLPTGAVLVAAAPDRRVARLQLFVTDARRTLVTRIDASALGTVSSISCEATGTRDSVVVATAAGQLYGVAASAIDGSALRPSS